MDKCPRCGADLKQNQKFCTKCGTKIEEKVTQKLSAEILAKIDILQKKISNDNLNSLLYINLGDIYFENEMYSEAILEYQKALNIDDGNFKALLKSAETYLKLNDYNKSELLYNKAAKISSTSQEVKIGLFWIYYFQKNFKKSIEISKDLIDDLKDIKYHKATKEVYEELGLQDNELKEMEIIYKLEPEDINNLNDLADSYYSNNIERSIELYKRILAIEKNDLNSRFIIAKHYLYKKNYKKTVEMFKDYVSSYPVELQQIINLYLAHAYLNLNETNRALAFSQHLILPKKEKTTPDDKKLIAETLFDLSNILVVRFSRVVYKN